MFENLQDRLSAIFDRLTGRGVLSAQDIAESLREIRRALIEADVALDVVRPFIAHIQEKATGVEIFKSVKPGQMVVKIVHDELVAMLGKEAAFIDLHAAAPVVIMLVGLQGAGKTTTTAKIAHHFTKKYGKKVLMASLDTQRPAAQEQLRQLGVQIDVKTLDIVAGQSPIAIADRAVETARQTGQDVVLLDTAGRTHIDMPLMAEVSAIRDRVNCHEILLVADSLTGQDSVHLARSFDEQVGLTGIILTRMDGDGRGGAALSMRAVTGKPIKAIAVGEKMDQLEEFHPSRIADRILGMGDIVSLVEKASEVIDSQKAAQFAKKLQAGTFDLNDLGDQLRQMKKLGGMGGIMGLLPAIGKMKNQLASAGFDDSIFDRQLAILSSMTREERAHPELLKHSRKQRIAKGSGTNAADINKLLKMHRQLADVMKTMTGNKGGGLLKSMAGGVMGELGEKLGLGKLGFGKLDLGKLDPGLGPSSSENEQLESFYEVKGETPATGHVDVSALLQEKGLKLSGKSSGLKSSGLKSFGLNSSILPGLPKKK